MSLHLPPMSSPLRELFEVADVVPFGMPGGMLKAPLFGVCRAQAQTMMADRAIAAVNCICLRANGALELVQFGPRGGVKRLWRFA